jgi:hypothetical protein
MIFSLVFASAAKRVLARGIAASGKIYNAVTSIANNTGCKRHLHIKDDAGSSGAVQYSGVLHRYVAQFKSAC